MADTIVKHNTEVNSKKMHIHLITSDNTVHKMLYKSQFLPVTTVKYIFNIQLSSKIIEIDFKIQFVLLFENNISQNKFYVFDIILNNIQRMTLLEN